MDDDDYLHDLAEALGAKTRGDQRLARQLVKETVFAADYHARISQYVDGLPDADAFVRRFTTILLVMAEDDGATPLAALTPAALAETVALHREPVAIAEIERRSEGRAIDRTDVAAAIRLHAGVHMAHHDGDDHTVGLAHSVNPDHAEQRDHLAATALRRLETHVSPYDEAAVTDDMARWAVSSSCTLASYMDDDGLIDERVSMLAAEGIVIGDADVRDAQDMAAAIARDAGAPETGPRRAQIAAAALRAVRAACAGGYAGLPDVASMPAMATIRGRDESKALDALRHMMRVVTSMLRIGGGVLPGDMPIDAMDVCADHDLLEQVRTAPDAASAVIMLAHEAHHAERDWMAFDREQREAEHVVALTIDRMAMMTADQLAGMLAAAAPAASPDGGDVVTLHAALVEASETTRDAREAAQRRMRAIAGRIATEQREAGFAMMSSVPPPVPFGRVAILAVQIAQRKGTDRVVACVVHQGRALLVVAEGRELRTLHADVQVDQPRQSAASRAGRPRLDAAEPTSRDTVH